MALPKLKKQTAKKKIPFLWFHLARAWQDITVFWRSMVGVVAVYALVYIITVIGLNFISPGLGFRQAGGALAGANNQGSIAKSIDAVINSYSFVFGDSSSSLVQVLLFLIASLAFIWTLRKIKQLKKVKITEAYYTGTAQIIPMCLVCLWYLLFLVPLAFCTTILSVGLAFANSTPEKSIIYLISALFGWLTLWLFAKYWAAFYVVSLPGIKPLQALRSAANISKGNRLNISIQVAGYIMLAVIAIATMLLPVGLILPAATPYLFFILIFLLFAASHTFMFAIYRSLVGDK